EQINHALSLVPKSSMALLQKAWILAHIGSHKEAMAIVQQKISQEDPFFVEFVCLRGHLAAKLGDFDRAKKCKARLDSIQESNPERSIMHQRIIIAFDLGDMKEAQRLMKENLKNYRGGMIFGLNDPFWASIWEDPHLAEIKNEFESQVTA
ncbi:MAG: hypothetical protein OEQ53_00180, partial [Saprospiraceae bacterium]|nr:hypothetical protein [Saprospiraceae bacterium]